MENKKVSFIIAILFVIFISAYFHYIMKKTDKVFDYLSEHYPTLRVSDSLNNKIVYVYQFPKDLAIRGRSAQYVELDDNRKFKLLAFGSPAFLDEVAVVGARVIKRAGSDTLIVEGYNKKYFFIIDKDAP